MKKIIIALIVLVFIVGIGASIFTMYQIMSPEADTEDSSQATETTEVNTEPTGETQTGEAKTDLEKDPGVPFEPIPKTTETLTKQEEQNIILSVKAMFRQFKFKEGSDLLSDAKNKNAFSSDSEVSRLYNDSAYLQHIEYGVTSGTYMGIDIIKVLKEPESVLLAMLYLDGYHREPYVRDDRSLSPEHSGKIEITGEVVLEKDDFIYKEIKRMDSQIKDVHKFSVTLDNNKILAYVGVSEKQTYLYRFDEETEGTTGYFTIKHIRDMQNLINGKNTKIQETTESEAGSLQSND